MQRKFVKTVQKFSVQTIRLSEHFDKIGFLIGLY